MAGAMPRRKPAPPATPVPTRRRRGTGSVAVRRDNRIAVTLPADLDPERKPLYSAPGTRTAWASVEQATRWLDAEVARRRNPTPDRATDDEQLGAYLARWYRLYSPTWPYRTATAYRQSRCERRGVRWSREHQPPINAARTRCASSWQSTRPHWTNTPSAV